MILELTMDAFWKRYISFWFNFYYVAKYTGPAIYGEIALAALLY